MLNSVFHGLQEISFKPKNHEKFNVSEQLPKSELASLFFYFLRSKSPLVFETPSELSFSLAFSASSSSISTIFSIPFFPRITGTPIQRSFKPYSPSSKAEHGNIFFWSQAIACTKEETAAPGAYQALVPSILVKVAPPTLVSSETCLILSSERNSEIANRITGCKAGQWHHSGIAVTANYHSVNI